MGYRLATLAILGGFLLGGCDIGIASANGDTPPYWSSLRYDKSNMRVGPGTTYPIDWEYRRAGLPVKVLRVREGWELVEDPDGAKGWFSTSQLSRRRTVLVTGDAPVALREEAREEAAMLWTVEPGAVGVLIGCEGQWCEVDFERRRGWMPAQPLWGDEDPGVVE